MNREVGWILDVYVQGDEAVTWLRTIEGQTLRITDAYHPSLYILPKTREDAKELFEALNRHPNIVALAFEDKFTELGSHERRKLLRVVVDGAHNFKTLLKGVEKLSQVKELYNTDLLHVQRYIFSKLCTPPTSKVEVRHDDEDRLVSMKRLDDGREISPPPFTALFFNIHTESQTLISKSSRNPIRRIEVRCRGEECMFQGEEAELLMDFSSFVQEVDPDLLVCPECDGFTFSYLLERVRMLGLDLQFGREEVDTRRLVKPLPYWVRGRVALSYGQWNIDFEEWGIAGMVERSRFSLLPPGIASRWTANRIIDSRNCYELMRRGYAVKRDSGGFGYARLLEDVFNRDRGGLIFASQINMVHENVAELDFESEYPALIVRNGLSYETVTPSGVEKRRDALLPLITKACLDRRLYFKRLRNSFPKDTMEWLWCQQRQEALKMILVCLYGTSGCCWNRYGNVLCFEEINKRSREALLKAKDLAQRRGFQVVYGDTDSIFLKKPGSTREEYGELCDEISKHIGLPIALDHHYKFLLLLPAESDLSGGMEAQKHYFGLLTNGEIIARGIEMRRHDIPSYVKDFQRRLIQTLFDCKDVEEVRTKGYSNAIGLVAESIDRLLKGEVPVEQLIVSKYLRRSLETYARRFPHISAALQLSDHGKKPRAGDKVSFVYVDADHPVPKQRVAALELYNDRHYDLEKYREMILDAAETILSTLGFSHKKFVSESKTMPLLDDPWRD